MQLDLQFDRVPETPQATVEPQVFTVAELTRRVRDLLENRLGNVWVEGEISNYRRQASGHQYFTLKDESSQLACVLFNGTGRTLERIQLSDGLQVQVLGAVTVYAARGQYQLIVQLVQERGYGVLQARFEALKLRLAAEGLFDPSRKRALPRFPSRVGVVTSPSGAAIRDFLKVTGRRMPCVEILIHPVRVQGRGAALQIAAAIREFSDAPGSGLPEVDVIVVTRGGGSIEDLWEFNEEAVARAIVASRVPVVSAVGHEIDFTISDFAADVRAPTPSAAAEMVAADAAELLHRLRIVRDRMRKITLDCFKYLMARCASLKRAGLFREPARILRERQQRLDALSSDLSYLVRDRAKILRQKLDAQRSSLLVVRPDRRIERLRAALTTSFERVASIASNRLQDRVERLRSRSALIRTLNPKAILNRGYTITTTPEGGILRTGSALSAGDAVITVFADGKVPMRATGGAVPPDET